MILSNSRVTFWPQAILGLTFNWGALVGSTAVLGIISPACMCLYLSGVCWTLVYDTIYALQDMRDDELTGIKSTAILFGQYLKPILCTFASMSVACLVLAGVLNESGVGYFLISCGGAATHFGWQIYTLRGAVDAGMKFLSNRNLGLVVAFGIVIDVLNLF